MLSRVKQSVERDAMNRTRPLTRGGTQPKHTRKAIPIVRIIVLPSRRSQPDILFPVAIQALTQTINHLTKSGRFRQAADREKEIGQIYLQEFHDLGKACDSFVRAGEWYSQEDAAA